MSRPIVRQFLGTVTLVKNFSTGAPPAVHTFEVWADHQAMACAIAYRAMRSKNRYAKAMHGAVMVKEVKA
jgi:hypothetical protein